MEQASRHIEKYCVPSVLNKAPFGTIAKMIIDKEKDEYVLYIQLSDDENKPRWEKLGKFFEEVFDEEFVSNEPFMEMCLALFKNLRDKNNDKSICTKINDVSS